MRRAQENPFAANVPGSVRISLRRCLFIAAAVIWLGLPLVANLPSVPLANPYGYVTFQLPVGATVQRDCAGWPLTSLRYEYTFRTSGWQFTGIIPVLPGIIANTSYVALIMATGLTAYRFFTKDLSQFTLVIFGSILAAAYLAFSMPNPAAPSIPILLLFQIPSMVVACMFTFKTLASTARRKAAA